MSANWNNPTTTSLYTDVLSILKDRDLDVATQFNNGTATNIPTNAVKWDATLKRWQLWSGTAWGELTATYQLTGVTCTSLNTTGNSTFGDSSADTVTVNAGTWTFNNAVAFGGVGALTFANNVTLNGTTTLGGSLVSNSAASFGATVSTGNGVSTGNAVFEVGGNRTGDGNAIVDLHGVTGTDFSARLIRAGGANGTLTLSNTGTGDLIIQQSGAGAVSIKTQGIERVRTDLNGNVGVNVAPVSRLDLNGNFSSNITVVSASAVDCSVGNYFTKTAAGALTWTFTNVPTSRAYSFVLELTDGGSGTQTWPIDVKWPSGTAPILVASGVDLLSFITDDGGTTWRGVQLMKDSK